MSLETSKKILKIFGILSIIGGVLTIILGIVGLAGGGLAATEDATVGGIVIVVGLIALVSGIVSLLEGIFSVKAAKDPSKIQPAWIFAVIGVVMSAISLIMGFVNNGASGAFSNILSLAISILIFVAANTIKKSNQ